MECIRNLKHSWMNGMNTLKHITIFQISHHSKPILMFIQCLGYCFYIYQPPFDVSGQGHSFLNNRLDNTELASLISDLHTKLRIISRGFQALPRVLLATFGAVGEPLWWSTFVFFLKNNSWYTNFGIEQILFIYIYTLPKFCLLFFLSIIFLSEIRFFI